MNALLFAFILGFIGARLFYLVHHYRFFIENPLEIFAFRKGGFSSYGAIIGGSIGAILYLIRTKISIRIFADCCAPSIAIGIFITRIGCFMNGCCFGKCSDVPWAVSFPQGSEPYRFHLYQGKISPTYMLSLPVHPIQLYESLLALLLFVLLLVFNKRKTIDGQLFLGFLILYSVGRVFLEFYREDFDLSTAALSFTQILSLVIAVAGTTAFIILTMRNREIQKQFDG